MGKQINQYTGTRATLLADDLLDIDTTNDAGSTFNSEKALYSTLVTQIGTDIGFSVGTYKEIPFVNLGSDGLSYSDEFLYDTFNRDLLIVSSLVNFEQGIEISSTNGGNAVYPRFRSDANGTFTEIGSYGIGHADTDLKQKSVIKSRGTTLGMVFLTQSAANDPFEWRSGLDGSDLQMTLSNGTLTLDTTPALDNTEDDILVILTNGNIARRSAGSIGGGGDMLIATYDPTAVGGDAFLRSNMNGTQTASTISDFDTEVSNNSAVTLNTAKLTNENHSGDVTGASALTAQPVMITGQTTVTGAAGDFVLITDASDSGNLKKVDLSDLLGGGGPSLGLVDRVPFMNTGATDFEYSAELKFTAFVGVVVASASVMGFRAINGGNKVDILTNGVVNLVRGGNTFQLDGAFGGVGSNGAAFFSSSGGMRMYVGADNNQFFLDTAGNCSMNYVISGIIPARLAVKGAGNTNATKTLFVSQLDGTKILEINDGSEIGVYNTAPVAQQTVTGSRGANAALADLLTKLANIGWIIDSTII